MKNLTIQCLRHVQACLMIPIALPMIVIMAFVVASVGPDDFGGQNQHHDD